jgi:hypothetical protein
LKSAVKFLRFFFFMVLGRNLPRTPQLSNLKSNQALGSIRRGHLSNHWLRFAGHLLGRSLQVAHP